LEPETHIIVVNKYRHQGVKNRFSKWSRLVQTSSSNTSNNLETTLTILAIV